MSLQCFVFSHLLCYGAVSSEVNQAVAALQAQILVGKILEGDWIQTPPRFVSSPDFRELVKSRPHGRLCCRWQFVFVPRNDTATGLGDE